MTRAKQIPVPRFALTPTGKTVLVLCLLALFGLLSKEWGASLILLGLAVLAPGFIRVQSALARIAYAADGGDQGGA